jgi:calcium permeable stress-gated cation channel
MKQLFTGIYLAEICLIGLFACSVAPGPLVLEVVFLIFTVLFHISLNSALDPLLYNLPLSLLEEEGQNLINGNGAPADGADPKLASNGGAAATPTGKKPGMLAKFLKPWVHADYATLKQWVPRNYADPNNLYSETVERDAYYPPNVSSAPPLLWIPEDPAGVSKQEVAHTSKVIPITDEGSQLDDKGNLVWDREATRPPVWEEKILY